VSASATEAPAQSTGVFINEKELTPAQIDGMRRTYGAAPPAGRYWYDSRSGLYGYWGFEAAGYIRPGHDFGDVSAKASRGNTGVFLNGGKSTQLRRSSFRGFLASYQGHFWLDGTTGNLASKVVRAFTESGCCFAAGQRPIDRGEYHRRATGAVPW
jgi:hypothetical protein